jgi:hypothetical protein
MKKPSWKTLGILFTGAVPVTTLFFVAYHVLRVWDPSVKTWLDSSGLDANAITAYFTALAFVGFLLTSVYQAYCNAVTEHELEEEKRRSQRLQHDSMWLTVQIARLSAFTQLNDQTNLQQTIREIEDHWSRLSKCMNDPRQKVEQDGASNSHRAGQ